MLYTDIYNDVFKFHKERMRAPMTPEYWESTIDMMTQICAKYDNSDFVADLLSAVFVELERRKEHG